ncbi:hypothetical protein ACHAXR_010124 [Thalassiosira sp. AJA248-18]
MVKRTYTVPSIMMLYDSDRLDNDASQTWRVVTEDRIIDATLDVIGADGEALLVTVSLDSQEVLNDRRLLAIANNNHYAVALDASIERERLNHQLWRTLQSSPLQIDFTTTIEFFERNSSIDLVSEEDWDANEMVASGFNTLDQQEEYIDSLKAVDSHFEDVGNIAMEVDDKFISGPPLFAAIANDEADSNRNIMIYAISGTIIGAACLVILLVIGFYDVRKRRKDHKQQQHQQLGDSGDELDDNDSDDTFNNSNDEEDAVYRTITAVAPPGKLGLVIANPRGDMPIVLQMKEGKVLQGNVRVGDLLSSIDEVGCRGMTALDVSNLIGSRSQAPARTLILLREQ